MNYGGMALEGLWRGMDFSNQRRQQQMAMEQQAFQNQMAMKQMQAQQEQWAFQKQQYQDEREESRRKNRQTDIKQAFEMLDRGAPPEMVFGIYGPDILPANQANAVASDAQGRQQQALDLHLYEKGLRRAGEADFADPEGLMSRPPQGMIMMGNVPTVPMPKQLPQEPVSMEYVTDENNVLRALPKAIMPGQVPQPIDTGVRMPVKGGAGGFNTHQTQIDKDGNLLLIGEDATTRFAYYPGTTEKVKVTDTKGKQFLANLLQQRIASQMRLYRDFPEDAAKDPLIKKLTEELDRLVYGGSPNSGTKSQRLSPVDGYDIEIVE